MKLKRALFLFAAVILLLSLLCSGAAAEPGGALAFDVEAEPVAAQTITVGETSVTYDVYRVCYVENPEVWASSTVSIGGADVPYAYQSMNILIPSSGGEGALAWEDMDASPILFYNRMGGFAPSAVPAPDVTLNAYEQQALASGWVVVQPGLRGSSALNNDWTEEYEHHGKVPHSLVDLKSAIRYLRYNDEVLPGDAELIFAMGSSAGGCMSSMLGASGNWEELDAYFEVYGAADERDDVFAAAPSCHIITVEWADLAYEHMFGTVGLPDPANPPEGYEIPNPDLAQLRLDLQAAMAADYAAYQAGLNIEVPFDGGTVGGEMIPLTADNVYDWLAASYVTPSIVEFLNESFSSQTEVEEYLAEEGNTITKLDDLTGVSTGSAGRGRAWITPVYGEDGEALVTGVTYDWGDYLSYLGRTKNPPSHDLALIYNELAGWYAKSGNVTDETEAAINDSRLDANGGVPPVSADVFAASYRNLFTATNSYLGQGYDVFGDDSSVTAAVMSDFGWKWIADKFDINVSEEYREFVEFQTHAMDPLYFILDPHGELNGGVDITKNWWIRQGAGDSGTGLQIVFNVADTLNMLGGYNVDAALVWDQGHALSSDVDEFFAWADRLLNSFDDVPADAWYFDAVDYARQTGLIDGKTGTTFEPDAELTYAEAVKIASAMHEKYTTGSVTLTNGDPWYQSYADYAKENGIIDGDYEWSAPATRAGYMEIFAKALPEEMFEEINSIPDNAIPDVPSDESEAAESIYKMYRAGIVEGVDGRHNCAPDASIKRSEVAAVLARMLNVSLRVEFDIT